MGEETEPQRWFAYEDTENSYTLGLLHHLYKQVTASSRRPHAALFHMERKILILDGNSFSSVYFIYLFIFFPHHNPRKIK